MPAKRYKDGWIWGDNKSTIYKSKAAAEQANAATNSSGAQHSVYWPARKPLSKKKPG